MLVKYKDVGRLEPKKGANKPFENALRQARIHNFFQRGRSKLRRFFKRSFLRQNCFKTN